MSNRERAERLIWSDDFMASASRYALNGKSHELVDAIERAIVAAVQDATAELRAELERERKAHEETRGALRECLRWAEGAITHRPSVQAVRGLIVLINAALCAGE